jgi:hypothetical protein
VDEQTASMMIKHAFLAGVRSASQSALPDTEAWTWVEPAFLAWVEQWNRKMRAGWKPDPLGAEADEGVGEAGAGWHSTTIRIDNPRPIIRGTVGG